jgi:hypothetical protein
MLARAAFLCSAQQHGFSLPASDEIAQGYEAAKARIAESMNSLSIAGTCAALEQADRLDDLHSIMSARAEFVVRSHRQGHVGNIPLCFFAEVDKPNSAIFRCFGAEVKRVIG